VKNQVAEQRFLNEILSINPDDSVFVRVIYLMLIIVFMTLVYYSILGRLYGVSLVLIW